MRGLLLFFCILTALGNENLYQAHQAYDQGDYQKAIELYQKEKISGGDASYNLGNFYFRNDQLGEAIFHYRRALELRPRDGDVKFNLDYARSKTVDKIEEKSNWLDSLSLKNICSLKEQLYLLVVFALLFWVLQGFTLFKRLEWIVWGKHAALVLFLGVLILLGKDYLTYRPFGVVTEQQVKVYSGIGRDNVVLFSLHVGAEFQYGDIEGEWIQVSLQDGKKGWLKRQQVITSG